jgi:long-chain acyl-CoA synthetase
MNPASTPNPPAFRAIPDLIREHARAEPVRRALAVCEGGAIRAIDYATLDARMDRVAAALQRDGLQAGDAIALCAAASIDYAAIYLGALRAGVVVAPLAPGSTPDSLARMLADAGARLLFTDAAAAETVGEAGAGKVPHIALDGSAAGQPLESWLAAPGAQPTPVALQPAQAFNIIYSSGTTGAPKGIVQSHGMRWAHVTRGATYGYGPDTVTLLSTPLYSNTTLVVFFPTLAFGGAVLLMPKFDAAAYLRLAEAQHVSPTPCWCRCSTSG